MIDFNIDERARESFINRLLALEVSPDSEEPRQAPQYDGPPPVAVIDAGDIRELRRSKVNKYGQRNAISKSVGGKLLWIDNDAFLLLKKIATDISQRCKLSESVSLEFVEDICAEFVFGNLEGKGVDLFQNLEVSVRDSVKEYEFHFPISGSVSNTRFIFAGVEFSGDPGIFRDLIGKVRVPPPNQESHKEAFEKKADQLERDYGKCMWAIVSITAEKSHAMNLARGRVSDATTFLRALCVQGYHPGHHVTLFPGETYYSSGEFSINRVKGAMGFTDGISPGHELLTFSPSYLHQLGSIGLGNLNALIVKETKTQMEDLCLRALSALGRAVSMKETSDKIVYACTALDLLFTRSKDEPILATMPRRFALFLGGSVQEKKDAEENIKYVYGKRSSRIHAGLETELEEAIFDFFRSIYLLAIRLTFLAGEHPDKKTFLDHLDERMLSG